MNAQVQVPAATNEITTLFPQGKEVTLKGEKFLVMPFGFGQFPKVLSLMKRLKDPAEGSQLTLATLGTMLADNADVVVEFSTLATKKPASFFEDVPMDEGVALVQAIIEVNADFFVKRLQPTVMQAIEALQNSLGALSSQS